MGFQKPIWSYLHSPLGKPQSVCLCVFKTSLNIHSSWKPTLHTPCSWGRLPVLFFLFLGGLKCIKTSKKQKTICIEKLKTQQFLWDGVQVDGKTWHHFTYVALPQIIKTSQRLKFHVPPPRSTLASHDQQSDRWQCISSASSRWQSQPGRGRAGPRGFGVSVKCQIPCIDEQSAPTPASTGRLCEAQYAARITRKRNVIHGDESREINVTPWEGEFLPWLLDDEGVDSVPDFSFPGKTDTLLDLPHARAKYCLLKK